MNRRAGNRPSGSGLLDLTVTEIRTIHHRLFEDTRDTAIGGVIRDRQNWIGGRDNPWGARFIPVPEDQVDRLLKDLCRFAARDDLSAVAQAAIVHAQFETIHPFSDGNGRVGRALIHLILRSRGLAPYYVPPISLVLAANYAQYERGLTAFREQKIEEWCGLFARSVAIACRAARELATRIEELKVRWREQAGAPRADSAAAKLIDLLPVQPVLDLRADPRDPEGCAGARSSRSSSNATSSRSRVGLTNGLPGLGGHRAAPAPCSCR